MAGGRGYLEAAAADAGAAGEWGSLGRHSVDRREAVIKQENLGTNAQGLGGRGGGHETYGVENSEREAYGRRVVRGF